MEKMKRLGFKDLDIIDNETNLDDYMCDKQDPMRIRQQEAIAKLSQNDQYEDLKFSNDQKKNPRENTKKRIDFIKN